MDFLKISISTLGFGMAKVFYEFKQVLVEKFLTKSCGFYTGIVQEGTFLCGCIYMLEIQDITSYSPIPFDDRVTFCLQRVRSLHCACVALFASRPTHNHYTIAHALKSKCYYLVEGNRTLEEDVNILDSDPLWLGRGKREATHIRIHKGNLNSCLLATACHWVV